MKSSTFVRLSANGVGDSGEKSFAAGIEEFYAVIPSEPVKVAGMRASGFWRVSIFPEPDYIDADQVGGEGNALSVSGNSGSVHFGRLHVYDGWQRAEDGAISRAIENGQQYVREIRAVH